MIPEIWGKHMWFSIHFIALDYPETPSVEDMSTYKFFYENLYKVLPCYRCAENYKRHLKELPIDNALSSRDALFAWTVEFHNLVNKLTHKPLMSLEQALAKYLDPEFNKKVIDSSAMIMAALEPTKPTKHLWWVCVLMFFVGLVIGGFVVWLNKNKRYK